MMHVKFPTKTLAGVLGDAARVAAPRSAIQALAGVQVSVGAARAEFRATNTEIGVRLPVDLADPEMVADVEEVLVPAKLFLDIARSLRAEEVTLSWTPGEREVLIQSGRSRIKLRTLRNEDFPRLPSMDDGESITLDAAAFRETVARVERAASKDETRPILTGIRIAVEDGRLRMVATDSYRLAVMEKDLRGRDAEGVELVVPSLPFAVVPAPAMVELARLNPTAETIRIRKSDNQIVFALDDTVLSSRLIDGQFPNFENLIPETVEHDVTVDREELLDVVSRVGLLAANNVATRFDFVPGGAVVSVETADVGEAREELDVEGYEGEALAIGFNGAFVRDGLEGAGAVDPAPAYDRVRLRLKGRESPAIIESLDRSYLYLVMPLRLPETATRVEPVRASEPVAEVAS